MLTERLELREPTAEDADFILQLLNDPGWLRYIGDRGVRTAAAALSYIEDRLLQSFREHGFGLWVVVDRATRRPLGLCGLLRRNTHPDVEIGFALLPAARGQGIAAEAALRALEHAERELRLQRLIALTLPDNGPSQRLLRRLGLAFERGVVFEGEDELIHIYSMTLPRTT